MFGQILFEKESQATLILYHKNLHQAYHIIAVSDLGASELASGCGLQHQRLKDRAGKA